MKFTRRKFIESSVIAAFAATIGQAAGGQGGQLLDVSSKRLDDPLEYLLREHFEPFINTSISIENDKGGRAIIWLREAEDLKNKINVDRGYTGESFRLGFDAPRKANLGQGTYHIDHDILGRFSLFIAPIGGSSVKYEAIINRVC
jgi:hypothetical protein